MKRFVAVLLIFLLSITSVAAIAEADFSMYTDAELREVRKQLDSEIKSRSFNDETADAVCLAFAEYMHELGHHIEYTTELGTATKFQPMIDTDLNSESITVVLMSGGYEVMLTDELAGNEAYIRDCMVAMAMAVAQVEGVEIFKGELSRAIDSCPEIEAFLGVSDSNDRYWYWPNSYGYAWTTIFMQESVLLAVK